MKIHPVTDESFHANGDTHTHTHTHTQTVLTKLVIAFRNFANTPRTV